MKIKTIFLPAMHCTVAHTPNHVPLCAFQKLFKTTMFDLNHVGLDNPLKLVIGRYKSTRVRGEVSPYHETPSLTMCPRDEDVPAVRK